MPDAINVLVVDDDRRMVKTICDILKLKGYGAIEAHSGEEAVEIIGAGLPDCVLMDLKMKGISGVDALSLIKRTRPGLPVILMSACASVEMEQEARQQGAYAVLSKPIDFQNILSFLSLLRKEESVLVVDDDPNFCRTLKDILQARGYAVETEMSGEHVLGHFEKNYQLAVILDLKLGSMNGIDVMQQIRARYPTKPVILVTGAKEDMAESIRQGLRIGAYTCVYKPLDTEALFILIQEISRKKLEHVLTTTNRNGDTS